MSTCPTCGDTHPKCLTPDCNNPTQCPPDESGEPFTLCDPCDAELSHPEATLGAHPQTSLHSACMDTSKVMDAIARQLTTGSEISWKEQIAMAQQLGEYATKLRIETTKAEGK